MGYQHPNQMGIPETKIHGVLQNPETNGLPKPLLDGQMGYIGLLLYQMVLQ